MTTPLHRPVMLNEVLQGLQIQECGMYLDGTLGSAGHAKAVIEVMGAGGRMIGIDCDEDAIHRSRQRLSAGSERCVIVQENFSNMGHVAEELGITQVDAILLDLGLSTEQLKDGQRGMSFLEEGPLDMRMDRSQGLRAQQIIESLARAVDLATLQQDIAVLKGSGVGVLAVENDG